ncbi:zinc ABC transporter substrate-binding protein ZnuA [Neptunomonas qingdaonensis]|uniref:High-affinity zinc uptake system protein ZnuA n=1 Tax=Neptunomonas qingdaonensis TaxID=1045558 RepID=A0A1I2LQU9_9GAMM|nr:zinc ABC transporter substrate-binding protein ZnuA [Neptunomonas qingdaonensis]SFF79767.1 zinc transport system substrate-binding protein [Neptunomonas qingdaonensis]
MRPQSFLLSLVFTVFLPVAAASELKVLTSIAPIQLIASEILADVTKPDVLLPAGASPHQYSLRPSDVRKVKQADLIFWVGPGLERFLEKTLRLTDARVVQLLESDSEHAHVHESQHQDASDNLLASSQQHKEQHEDHHHGDSDPHIWLDPLHALEIAEVIRDAAVNAAPEQQQILDKNYAEFAEALLQQDKRIMTELAPLSQRGFVVFHDAYSGFVEHYNLLQLDAVTVDPSRKAGAKHIIELREAVIQSKAVCVFSEPQFNAAVLKTITSGTSIRTAELDPLGQKIEPGKGAYLAFLADFAEAFKACLQS